MKRFSLKSQEGNKENIKNLLAFIANFILVALNGKAADQQTHHHSHIKDTDY